MSYWTVSAEKPFLGKELRMGRRGQGGFCPGAAMAGLRQGEIPASLREHAFLVGSAPGAGAGALV